ncbi:MAG: class I SAM-dependent methyltransferase [Vicinamibacterales bacterium]
MHTETRWRYALPVVLVLAGVVASAQAPAGQQPYKPTVGQPGKDAVWVPTSEALIEKMLDMAAITPKDFVMDLGSGDGRTIIAAAKRGVRALGVEYNADLVEYSKRAAETAGVGDKASFVQGDMYAADISKATVLALFLLPSNLEKLAPKFLALPPGSRIVVNTFWIEGWEPDETQTLTENCENWCTAKLFIIPAKVEGKWRLPDGELALTQKYQMVSGTYTGASGTTLQVKGRLLGDKLNLVVGDTEYEGRVDGSTIEGAPVSGDNRSTVKATRIG